MSIDEIQEQQGWSDESLLTLIRGWLMFRGEEEALARYLDGVAKEENEQTEEEE